MENTKANAPNPLGTAPILPLIAKFAIPSIISMLVSTIYNITDQIFIGNVVGMYGNAATNVAFPTVTLAVAFAQMIGIGTAANFNINMGAKREGEAKKYLETGLALIPLVGLAIAALILLFQEPILLLCGATENVLPLAKTYLSVTAFGIPFVLLFTSGSYIIRADGSPTYSMICTVTGAVLNIGLDALFMLVFDWGIFGAALATIIGQILSAVMCVAYLPKFKTFRLRVSDLRVRGGYLVQIAKLGVSNFVNMSIMMLLNITLNNVLRKYGAESVYGSDIPLAVSGVAAKLNSILASFAVGLAMGCQPIWSFNLGARQYKRVRETYVKALTAALCVGVVVFFMFQTFPRPIISIFGSGEELYYEFAERYLRIYMMMVIIYSIQPMTVNYFTGTGRVKQGLIMSITRQGIFLIPLLIILPMFYGIDGVLYSAPISDTLAAILSLTLIVIDFRRLKQMEESKVFEPGLVGV